MKHIMQRDLTYSIGVIARFLCAEYYTKDEIKALMLYLAQVGDVEAPETLLSSIASLSGQHEETIMTIAEALEQKGRREAYREAYLESKKAALETARELKAAGMSIETIKQVLRAFSLTDDDLQQLH